MPYEVGEKVEMVFGTFPEYYTPGRGIPVSPEKQAHPNVIRRPQ